MTSFSSLARALELKTAFLEIVKKDKSSGFKDLTPYVASAIISSKTKNEKILDICKDYLECRAFHVIQEKQQ